MNRIEPEDGRTQLMVMRPYSRRAESSASLTVELKQRAICAPGSLLVSVNVRIVPFAVAVGSMVGISSLELELQCNHEVSNGAEADICLC